MTGFVRKYNIDYVLTNKDGKELARVNLGKVSQMEINLMEKAKYAFHDQIAHYMIVINEEKKTFKKEPEQLSLFTVE